ncbi:MAG: ABC transporter ATP-binding protein [Pseudomonadota bacterium]
MIEAQNLSLEYGNKTVLRSLNLSFSPGEITVLIGANGCGKSTLLRALAGLQVPSDGEVLLNGRLISVLARKEIAKEIGYLSQSPQAPEGITVRQLVEHGAFARSPLFRRPDPRDIDQALDRVNLLAFAERPFDSLSGGERQRAWIALVLLQSPKMLLLDEPTSFLDLGYRVDILRLIEELKAERGLGVIMVLHDMNEVLRFADRVVALHSGRVLRDGGKDVIDPGLLETLFQAEVSLERAQGAKVFVVPHW